MSEQIYADPPTGFGVTWLHPCALHGEGEGWYDTDDNVPYCPDCGTMLNIEDCIWGCGANWLAYGDDTGDDLMADAAVTPEGDLVCARCAMRYEEDEQQDYSDDWQDDYP